MSLTSTCILVGGHIDALSHRRTLVICHSARAAVGVRVEFLAFLAAKRGAQLGPGKADVEGIALHSVRHGPIDVAALEGWREKGSLGNTLAGGLVEALAAVALEDSCGLEGS